MVMVILIVMVMVMIMVMVMVMAMAMAMAINCHDKPLDDKANEVNKKGYKYGLWYHVPLASMVIR